MAELELADILTGVPLPLVLIDAEDRISHMNPAGTALFGSAVTGRHYLTVLRQPALAESIAEARARHRPQQARYTRRDHVQETIFRTHATPVGPPGAGVVVSFEDVSQQESASQMRRDFVANVSHELRTPLTALLGFIETLRGPAREDTEARARFLDVMEREAQRMNRLVNDLLSLSRVETEERVRPTELQAVPDLVDSVCRALAPLADERAVRLEILPPPADLPLVLADADQLMQVFSNLIENAIKYGAEGERVEVAFGRVARDPVMGGPALSVEVRDFGPGIDSIHVHRLTERFYRIDKHRSQAVGGTGLGLAIVKHILNRHRGRLVIDSKLRQGSRFSVLLPEPQG